MTKPQNISAIETATGWKWQEWLDWLDARQAKTRSHTEIARLIHAELDGTVDSASWWAQGVTVAYEQHIGRRRPGQNSDGSFDVSVSKTVPLKREQLFDAWLVKLQKQTEANAHRIDGFRTSITPVRSYIRFSLDDKTHVAFAIEAKSSDTSLLVVTHSKLSTKAAADSWRAYWKGYLTSESPAANNA